MQGKLQCIEIPDWSRVSSSMSTCISLPPDEYQKFAGKRKPILPNYLWSNNLHKSVKSCSWSVPDISGNNIRHFHLCAKPPASLPGFPPSLLPSLSLYISCFLSLDFSNLIIFNKVIARRTGCFGSCNHSPAGIEK